MGVLTFRVYLTLVVRHGDVNYHLNETVEEWTFNDWRIADQTIERTIYEWLLPSTETDRWHSWNDWNRHYYGGNQDPHRDLHQ